MPAYQLLCLLLGDRHRQGRGAEVARAAEEDLISAAVFLAPDDPLRTIAGIAGVIPAIVELAYP